MFVKYNLDAKGTGHVFERKGLVIKTASRFQQIEISDLDILGRVLVLDNIIQLSELDSDRYHETFCHIPLSNLQNPTNALILGGGDGVLANELLKYKDMSIDLVDIDETVCELSKMHLSHLNEDAFANDRVFVHNGDALDFAKKAATVNKKYDIVFADITDPHPDSPSNSLLSKNALCIYKSILKKGGIFVAQTDNVQIAPTHKDDMLGKLSDCFQHKGSFGIAALTLSSIFSFVWASDDIIIKEMPLTVKTSWLTQERFDMCLKILRIH